MIRKCPVRTPMAHFASGGCVTASTPQINKIVDRQGFYLEKEGDQGRRSLTRAREPHRLASNGERSCKPKG